MGEKPEANDAVCRADGAAKGKPWRGIPREEIDWHPTITADLCDGCGACINGCCNGVYEWEPSTGKPVVVNQKNCAVGCVSCSKRCSLGAVTFPDPSYLEELLKKFAR
jgi:NAD-dependent dihydropyrimidine dehydrogenase PreA subunit